MTWWQRFWRYCRLGTEAVWASLLTRHGLALLALLISFGAGVVFSLLLAWNILYLQAEKRSDDIANLSIGLLLTLAMIMFSLHRLLGSKQAIEAEVWKIKFKASNGESLDDAPKP